jgi:PadR family transcriptional regulator, regulatory protein PadR
MPTQPPLGEFEITVLLAVMQLDGTASGTTVRQEIQRRTGRSVARGAVYVTLDRLAGKGLLSARLGETTPARGGHPQRFFRVTAAGRRGVRHTLTMFAQMQAGLEPVLEQP